MCHFYGFEAGQLAVSIYILSALPINQSVYCYIVTIPWMVNIVYCSVLDLALWRWGPVVVHHKVYPVFYLLSVALFMPLVCVAYLGPLSSVPWNNRLHFVFANGVGNFCFIQTGTTKTPREHPKVPRSSLLQPFSRAAINTMLIMDAWTDLTLVRSFLDRVWLAAFQCCSAPDPTCCDEHEMAHIQRLSCYGIMGSDTIAVSHARHTVLTEH